jgi:hypothetical protein
MANTRASMIMIANTKASRIPRKVKARRITSITKRRKRKRPKKHSSKRRRKNNRLLKFVKMKWTMLKLMNYLPKKKPRC